MNLTVGILAPRSFTVPLFMQQIVRGVKQGFEAEGLTAQFMIEDIGKAVDENLVISKANNLIFNEVDIIFAVVGNKVDVALINLCTAAQKPLILIDAGAAITRNDVLPASHFVFTNSYDMWHACMLLGQYAAGHISKKALATGAFFESGYSFLPAFTEGYTKMGGEIVGVHLCKDFKPEDFTQNLAEMIQGTQPEMLVAFYNGKDADDFYNYAVKTGVTKNLPVITTSLAAWPFTGSEYPVTSGWIWNANSIHEGNKKFIDGYMAKHQAMPDEYAAIAYESALVAASAAKKMGDSFFNANAFCRLLKETTVEGPRGPFSFNVDTNRNNGFGTTITNGDKTTEMKLTAEEIEGVKQHFSQWPHSGWFNPYPCA